MNRATQCSYYQTDYAQAYDEHWPAFDWGSLIWFLLDAARSHRGRIDSWLDLCCGAGHSLAQLTEAPIDRLFGLDLSEALIRRATDRLGGRAHCWVADACGFHLRQPVDVISCLGGSIHQLGSENAMATMLRQVAGHLSKRGVLLLDANTEPGMTVADGSALAFVGETTLCVQISYEPTDRLATWSATGFIPIAGTQTYRRFCENHQLNIFPVSTLARLLDESGFQYRFFDTEQLTEADDQSMQIACVAFLK